MASARNLRFYLQQSLTSRCTTNTRNFSSLRSLLSSSSSRNISVNGTLVAQPAFYDSILFNDEDGTMIDSVTIGNVKIPIAAAAAATAKTTTKMTTSQPPTPHYELIPSGYLTQEAINDVEILGHLRWMAQKDLLGQDIFLIGDPGPYRRRLALMYCEMTQKEVEYISITRDTSESDLKQRRELENGSAYYVDQVAVRAALNGRILILEGIEKAERNVLPVLNNLLENREMSLEDGRTLIHPKRYDALLQTHTKEELDRLKFVRVSENFRVIALGLPVPPYPGNTLDAPLRSRFQARDIRHKSVESLYTNLRSKFPNIPSSLLEHILSFTESLALTARNSGNAFATTALPPFPETHLEDLVRILQQFPNTYHIDALVRTLYPYEVFLSSSSSQRDIVDKSLKRLQAEFEKTGIFNQQQQQQQRTAGHYVFCSAHRRDSALDVTLNWKPTADADAGAADGGSTSITLQDVACGEQNESRLTNSFVELPYHMRIISEMIISHSIGRDICLIGGKAVGKSILARTFASILGMKTEYLPLYKDMTSRDLLQRRVTDRQGNTRWELTPLVHAMKRGRVAILDGIDRLSADTLAVLQSLITDRELTLFDGTKFVSQGVFFRLMKRFGYVSPEELERNQRVFAIHPSFRIVALALPPSTSSNNWLTPEILNLFHFNRVEPLSFEDEFRLVKSKQPSINDAQLTSLVNVAHSLRSHSTQNLATAHRYSKHQHQQQQQQQQQRARQASSRVLSTRDLLRIAKRLSQYPSDSLAECVANAMMYRFMPMEQKELLQSILREHGILKSETLHSYQQGHNDNGDDVKLEIVVEQQNSDNNNNNNENYLSIGGVRAAISSTSNPAYVPQIVFYPLREHLLMMREMMKDFNVGEHILLIGNQGVGKNKIADYFLQCLRLEKEYLQLHRDTTVQSLTVQPSVINGALVWEDSPLVRAVKNGRVLILDEADKAPLEVVSILKSLIEDGEMVLNDGRRIVQQGRDAISDNDIVIHPEFRMIVLANRPGFPFHGNDFFRECGDIFSSYVIDHPGVSSERALLRSYAPNVPEPIINKLIHIFSDLRAAVEDGLISYPYSTRELVNIVKHLELFPSDGLATAVKNVLSFDSYDTIVIQQLAGVFERHGVPLDFQLAHFQHQQGVKRNLLTQPQPLPAIEFRYTVKAQKKEEDNDGEGTGVVPVHTTTFRLRDVRLWNGDSFYFGRDMPHSALKLEKSNKRDARLHQFSELKCEVQVPTEKVLSMCTLSDNSIHMLSAKPFALISYPDLDHYSTLDLYQFYNSFEYYPRMVALKKTNHVCLLGESRSREGEITMMLIKYPFTDSKSDIRMANLSTTITTSKSGSMSSMTSSLTSFFRAQKQPQAVFLDAFTAESNTVAFYMQYSGEPVLHLIDFTHGTQHSLRISNSSSSSSSSSSRRPMLISRVDWIAPREFLVEVVDSLPLPHQDSTAATATTTKKQYVHVELSADAAGCLTTAHVRHLEFEPSATTTTAPPPPSLRWDFVSPNNNEDDTQLLTRLLMRDESSSSSLIEHSIRRNHHHHHHKSWRVHFAKNNDTLAQVLCAPLREEPSSEQSDDKEYHVYSYPRDQQQQQQQPGTVLATKKSVWLNQTNNLVSLSECHPPGKPFEQALEVIDFHRGSIRRIPANTTLARIQQQQGDIDESGRQKEDDFDYGANCIGVLAELHDGSLVTLHRATRCTTMKVWEVDSQRLQSEFDTWCKITGYADDANSSREKKKLRMEFVSNRKKEAKGPKHGKEDPTNAPHVGGNTWAGGTGGSDTAGLGGKGGPYRLDKGHDVHQMPDEEKRKVSEEVKQRAREMGQEALQQRLREIEMTSENLKTYNSFYERVELPIQQLRTILASVEAKQRERIWLRNQSAGELDEARLVEGLVGERLVYKRRGVPDDLSNNPAALDPSKPKRISFVMDVSGSMYRFNGLDGRLNRIMETAVLIMESFVGFEKKFNISIVGHSGDSDEINLVGSNSNSSSTTSLLPSNPKERLVVISKMHAHAQYCSSGDNTLEATRTAINALAAQEADEHFVFVFSDANLERYGIHPSQLGRVLTSNEKVKAFVIFIASLGDEADRIVKNMPPGRAYVCMDIAKLPQTFKQIFTSNVLNNQ